METGRKEGKKEGRDSVSGLVRRLFARLSSTSLFSFRRSLIKVQLQVKLKHDDNVAGSRLSPPLPSVQEKESFLRIEGRSWVELERS